MGLLSRPERELCSVGVPHAVTGASRSRQGAGRMPISANLTRPGGVIHPIVPDAALFVPDLGLTQRTHRRTGRLPSSYLRSWPLGTAKAACPVTRQPSYGESVNPAPSPGTYPGLMSASPVRGSLLQAAKCPATIRVPPEATVSTFLTVVPGKKPTVNNKTIYRGRMNLTKRKGSCTSKREISLQIQERIYPLFISPTLGRGSDPASRVFP